MHQQAELAAVSVAAKERALIEGAYVMARKFPRNEEDARARILKTCKIFVFAEKAKYKKPVGGKDIIGPTIRLAEEIMRQWGHMRVEGVVLYDDTQKRIIQVSALDLQTGANAIMQFPVEKTVERKNSSGREVIFERINSYNEKVSIVVATEDEVMVKQNAMLSKYRRNLILQLVPTDIVEDAKAVVDETIKRGIKENPDREKKVVMDNFSKLGVIPSELEKYIGHPIAQLTTDEIADLKDVYNSVNEGEDTWKNILAAKITESTPASTEKATSETNPKTATFKPGDAGTHQSVKDPITNERDELIKNIQSVGKEVNKSEADRIYAKYKIPNLNNLKDLDLETLQSLLGDLNFAND